MFKRILVILSFLFVVSVSGALRADPITLPPPPEVPAGEPDVGKAISPLKRFQSAPFSGVLLSPRALADIVVELESFNERIKIEVERARAEERADGKFKLAEAKAAALADTKILQARIEENDKTRKILEDRLKAEEAARPNAIVWAGVGFAGGVVSTVLVVIGVSVALANQ